MKALTGLLLVLGAVLCLRRRVPPVSAMGEGIGEGLRTVLRIFPPAAAILVAASMLRACGALDALAALLGPGLEKLGIPRETVGLLLLRPLSGSGALAVGGSIIREAGADSPVGRVAAVMLGSTETTFYVLGVYFGAAGIRRTGKVVPAALAADLAGFLAAGISVRLLFGRG